MDELDEVVLLGFVLLESEVVEELFVELLLIR